MGTQVVDVEERVASGALLGLAAPDEGGLQPEGPLRIFPEGDTHGHFLDR